ncbi:unnamed protein product [Coffea canephora]|uniref:Transcriptional factor DELLA N-terminal domain-containing protein n=1 Tax=Coffea canephora TaxID=49390 RepID=A0A068URY4_COFCA|nr:unnamed protein product [Coffea canephora]
MTLSTNLTGIKGELKMKINHPKLQQPSAAVARVQVQESNYSGGGGSSTGSGSYYSTMASCSSAGGGSQSKGKMWVDESDRQDDELLAVLGYKVKASDMAEVAQKIEQLEEVFGNAENDSLSHLVSETVHYNPSDLSSWLGSMISEFYSNMSSIPDSSAIFDEFKHKSAKHEQTKMPFNSGQICTQSHRKSSKYAF